MSGHNRWSKIKNKKGATDAKRGQAFTKIIKEITVAARNGGGSPTGNPRLARAIEDAKAVNMPSDNMQRAIKKGTGELEGVNYEEISYEGYGPGGVAILVETLSDNKNRTVAEVRHILSKGGGNLGATGSVAWMFKRQGSIAVPKAKGVEEEKLTELVLEVGGEDLRDEGDEFEVITDPNSLDSVRTALVEKGIAIAAARHVMTPSTTIKLAGHEASQMLKLIDALEDNEDVQHVFSNFDIDEAELEKLSV